MYNDFSLQEHACLHKHNPFRFHAARFRLPSSSSSYGRVSMIRVRHKKEWRRGFILLSSKCCPDQMLTVTELSQHLVLSIKTVRPIIPRGARCVGHAKIMCSAVCSLAPHSHFAEEARPHLYMNEPKRSTPVRK